MLQTELSEIGSLYHLLRRATQRRHDIDRCMIALHGGAEAARKRALRQTYEKTERTIAELESAIALATATSRGDAVIQLSVLGGIVNGEDSRRRPGEGDMQVMVARLIRSVMRAVHV